MQFFLGSERGSSPSTTEDEVDTETFTFFPVQPTPKKTVHSTGTQKKYAIYIFFCAASMKKKVTQFIKKSARNLQQKKKNEQG